MRLFALTAAMLLGSGCGSASDPDLPKLFPVSGIVTLDGAAVARAQVSFIPQGSTPGSGTMGMTDAAGKYELTTMHQGAGAPAGEYKVVISKLVQPDGSEFPPQANLDMMSTPHKELIPRQYSDLEQTKLTATVAEGGGSFDFPLVSKR